MSDDIEFVIMGCDGIWDCVDVQKFCEQISMDLQVNKMNPSVLISSLLDQIVSRTKECRLFLINLI